MSQSSLSDSFEYLCYGSTIILYILTMTVRGSHFSRQNLTTKVDPRTIRARREKRL